MNPSLIHQMAQARQADLLREAEEYRRAGLTARPAVLSRVTARIPRFTARIPRFTAGTGGAASVSSRRRHPAVREGCRRAARTPAGRAVIGDGGRSVGLIDLQHSRVDRTDVR
jgi:hypothetical protein